MQTRQGFPTTSWTLLFGAAAETGSPALEQFCILYWPPVFAFIRARVRDTEEAKDLTQAFFARLIERNDLRAVDPHRGRFRSFLFAAVSHFLSNEWDRQRAQKRGGGGWFWPSRSAEAETPESIFERQWAILMLDHALVRLRTEQEEAGHQRQFDVLKGYLTSAGEDRSYREAGEALGTSETAVRMAVHRLRRRFGEALRQEVGLTVGGPAEVEAEVRHLLSVLAG